MFVEKCSEAHISCSVKELLDENKANAVPHQIIKKNYKNFAFNSLNFILFFNLKVIYYPYLILIIILIIPNRF